MYQRRELASQQEETGRTQLALMSFETLATISRRLTCWGRTCGIFNRFRSCWCCRRCRDSWCRGGGGLRSLGVACRCKTSQHTCMKTDNLAKSLTFGGRICRSSSWSCHHRCWCCWSCHCSCRRRRASCWDRSSSSRRSGARGRWSITLLRFTGRSCRGGRLGLRLVLILALQEALETGCNFVEGIRSFAKRCKLAYTPIRILSTIFSGLS